MTALLERVEAVARDVDDTAVMFGSILRDVEVMQARSLAGTERLERALATVEEVLASETFSHNLADGVLRDLYGHLSAFTSQDRAENAGEMRQILRDFAATAQTVLASQRDAALGKPLLPAIEPSATPLEKANAILLRAYIRCQRFCLEAQPVAITGICAGIWVATAIYAYRLLR